MGGVDPEHLFAGRRAVFNGVRRSLGFSANQACRGYHRRANHYLTAIGINCVSHDSSPS
jgi:hypothetical protein